MSKASAERYSTCADFATDLGKALGVAPGQPIATDSSQPAIGPVTELANPVSNGGQPTWAPAPTPLPQVAAEPPPPRARSGSVVAIVVGAVAIAVVAAVATVFVVVDKNPKPIANPTGTTSSPKPSPSPSTSPSPSPSTNTANTAAAQARAMNTVLTASTASRISLQGPVEDVSACRDLGAAISQFGQVSAERSQQLASAEDLSVTALPNGYALKSELAQALRVFRSSDQDYLQWAEHEQATACADGGSAPEAVTASNQRSDSAKMIFNDNWNQVAERYGYPTDPNF
jgi:hypothetical protein